MLVVVPNSCLPLTWPNSQPYVHPHRTLYNPQSGEAAAGVPWPCSGKESQKGQRVSDRSGLQVLGHRQTEWPLVLGIGAERRAHSTTTVVL